MRDWSSDVCSSDLIEPDVLLMDEPLSNLDAKLRLEMRYKLQRLHVETGSTFVYVTLFEQSSDVQYPYCRIL